MSCRRRPFPARRARVAAGPARRVRTILAWPRRLFKSTEMLLSFPLMNTLSPASRLGRPRLGRPRRHPPAGLGIGGRRHPPGPTGLPCSLRVPQERRGGAVARRGRTPPRTAMWGYLGRGELAVGARHRRLPRARATRACPPAPRPPPPAPARPRPRQSHAPPRPMPAQEKAQAQA